MVWAGWTYASDSWVIKEHSSISADGPPIYPFKTIIPLAGALLLLQGFVEMAALLSLPQQDGKWPARASDVEEVDVEKLKPHGAGARRGHRCPRPIVADTDLQGAEIMRKELWFGSS
jgi:hypothetical protein